MTEQNYRLAHERHTAIRKMRDFSVVSAWKIIVKIRLGKLPLPAPIQQMIAPMTGSGMVRLLPLTEHATYRLQSLPDIHRDPFDRMPICQAIEGNLTLLTPDATFYKYPAPTLW